MADKFDLSFLDEPPQRPSLPAKTKPEKRPLKPKQPPFDDAFAEVGRREIRQATQTGQSLQSGRYEQLTFRLSPSVIDEIAAMADELGVSKEEMKRWIVYRGVQAWRDGERPSTEQRVVRKQVVMPIED